MSGAAGQKQGDGGAEDNMSHLDFSLSDEVAAGADHAADDASTLVWRDILARLSGI